LERVSARHHLGRRTRTPASRLIYTSAASFVLFDSFLKNNECSGILLAPLIEPFELVSTKSSLQFGTLSPLFGSWKIEATKKFWVQISSDCCMHDFLLELV
jgi:hypothetical protein